MDSLLEVRFILRNPSLELFHAICQHGSLLLYLCQSLRLGSVRLLHTHKHEHMSQGTFGMIPGTFGMIQGKFRVIQGTFGVIRETYVSDFNLQLFHTSREHCSLLLFSLVVHSSARVCVFSG
jgi:hypothetical protein